MTGPWWRWPLEVATAWLMPWRAVRTIHAQDKDMRLPIRMLALYASDEDTPFSTGRMGGWWNAPHPLAVATAALMPWRAVEELRSSQRNFLYMCDAIVRAHRRDKEFRAQLGMPAEAEPRHVHVVQ